jgi:hypothetical protein
LLVPQAIVPLLKKGRIAKAMVRYDAVATTTIKTATNRFCRCLGTVVSFCP